MKSVLFSFLFACTFLFSFAQDSAITKVPKFKPPVVASYLGINTNGAAVTVQEAQQLISLPLKITDTKKNNYTIDSYHFLYRRKGVIQDEKTGKKSTTFTIVSDFFKTTPLPKTWTDNIKDGFQKDEELYFFDIIVKDNKNRKFFAPDLKITLR
ncbi:hypothetical protein FW778_09730 [Ginsengibacter hankyongi]|uniref:Uncharacterized protein n=1 Tax=Ginsengibacter hankyongi TaxID=2607284 RepID=A0A5J5IHQ7_9BACT|nr:hypothetical protein [Ginsengibacter hankyongi]KAA9039108.1 hypothetical protein FW778_09730 [Ginsengibacter hankyongi]